jgi:hypothetical protein
MSQPITGYHENKDTILTEPVYIFTDEAVVRPRPQGESAPPAPADPRQDQSTLPTSEPEQED